MTLPTNITLPIEQNLILSEKPSDLLEAIKKLTYVLSTFMQQTNEAVNGTTLMYTEVPIINGYPFIAGSTTIGTALYTNTILWARRVNGMVFSWFDVNWNTATGTGNVLIQLPYFSQPSLQQPYVCVIESDSMAFTAGYTYLTGNLIPDTNTIEIHQCGSGQPVIPLPITAVGHLRGSIFYAGQQFK